VNDSKNLILAVVLSALVLLGWSWAANRFFPTAAPPSTKIENGQQQPVPQPQVQQGEIQQPSGQITPAQGPLRSRAAVLGSTPRVKIETPSLQGSINLKGAQIDDLLLVRQRESLAKDSPPVRLLSPLGAPGAYIASFGWTGQGTATPTLDTVWTADSAVLAPGRPVTLSTQSANGLRYQMRISVDDGYLFSVDQRVNNASGKPVVVRPIGLVSRASKAADPDSWTMHIGPMSVFGGTADYDVDYETLDEESAKAFGNVSGWLGFTDKYWLTALAPAGNAALAGGFRRSPSGGYQADYALAPAAVAPGQTLTTKTRLFAGAKEKAFLDRYEDGGIVKLSKARLGLVRMVHAPDLRLAGVPVQNGG
jgi:YidC/Oxa1 family membrane protein insertase